LLAVAVTDLLPNGLSAVYTFYEPEKAPQGRSRSWQIGEALRLGLDAVYLGYWIKNCKNELQDPISPHRIAD
jgi:arginine-tRNA-protein transferase